MSAIEEATSQSIKPFRSSEEYLFAMKEDLAEWLRELHGVPVWGHTFAEALETGSLLCQHANEVTRAARCFLLEHGTVQGPHMRLPARGVTFNHAAPRASFAARDNVSNFISWCRTEMGIADVLMFETEDLVLRKNEKNFVLCLLEVARRASRFGMAAPLLIRMEEEIEQEIHEDLHVPDERKALSRAQRRASDFKNLDEMVQHLVNCCSCPTQFPMVKVSEGKYRVGDSSTVIFVRILRNHVMVRVGGGWDTLEHYLDKHDPCRCTSLSHKQSRSGLQHATTPVHGVMACVGQNRSQTTLLVSRLQSPPPPVCRSPFGPTQSAKPGSTSACLRRTSSPKPCSRANKEPRPPIPSRARERSATPSDSGEDSSMQRASTRTGREATRQGPSPRMASSLPRPTESSSASQPEVQHPKTPLIFQRNPLPPFLHPVQHNLDARLTQTWRKSQFASKQKQSIAQYMEAQNGVANPVSVQSHGGLLSAKSSTLVCSYVPTQNIHQNSRSLKETIQPSEGSGSSLQTLDFIGTFSPTRHMRNEALDHCDAPTFSKSTPKDCLLDQTAQRIYTPLNYRTTSKNISKVMRKDWLSSSAQDALNFPSEHEDAINNQIFCQSVTDPSNSHVEHQDFKQLHNKDKEEHDREENRRYAFIPQSVSPAQEASLYQSLEHEILANLQLLDVDLDGSSSEEDPNRGGRTEKVASACKSVPLPCPLGARLSSSGSTAQVGASAMFDSRENIYSGVVTELLERKSVLRSVDMESWVAKLPSKSGDKIQVQDAEVNTGWVKGSKPSSASSWSSLASSMKSDDFQYSTEGQNEECGNDAADARFEAPETPASLIGIIQGPGKQGNPSLKQNRTLKKPERVPSIYKLKLHPRVRPRCDHRAEKKPSKIPAPLFYRRGQSGQNSQKERRQGAPVAPLACWEGPDSQKGLEPSLKNQVKRATEEIQANQEQETWV